MVDPGPGGESQNQIICLRVYIVVPSYEGILFPTCRDSPIFHGNFVGAKGWEQPPAMKHRCFVI